MMKIQQTTKAVDKLIGALQAFRALAFRADEVADVLNCGNGVSAADALHIAEVLVGR